MADKMVEITLIDVSGKEILLHFPQDQIDEIWPDMMEAWEMGKVWWCGNFVDLNVNVRGNVVDYLDMNKIIGGRE